MVSHEGATSLAATTSAPRTACTPTPTTHAQNRAVFGKCNNPHGHGHNYTVQVTLGGPVDPATGMVCNLAELDAFAQTNLLARFDHMNLNTLDCFREHRLDHGKSKIEIHRIFQAFPAAKLERVHIEETSNNSFDYAGDATPAPGTI